MESILCDSEKGGGQGVEKEKIEEKTGSINNNTVQSPTDDTFLYETKYVVLNFMKLLPKDVNERSWTPVSSSGSDRENFGEAAQKLTPISEQDLSVDKVRISKDHPGEDVVSPQNETGNVSKIKRKSRMYGSAEKRNTIPVPVTTESNTNSPHQSIDVSTSATKSPNYIDGEEETNSKNYISTDSNYTSDKPKNGGQEKENLPENSDKALDLLSRSTSANSSHGEGSYYSDADDELDCSSSSGQQSSRSSSDTKQIMNSGYMPASINSNLSPEAKYRTGLEEFQQISSDDLGVIGTWTIQAQSGMSSRNQHEQTEKDRCVIARNNIGFAKSSAPVSDESSDVPDGTSDQMSSSSTSLKLSSASGKGSTNMQDGEQSGRTHLSSTSTDTITTTLETRSPPDRSLLTLDISTSCQGDGQGTRHPKLSESMNSEIMRSWTSLESEVEEAVRHHRIASSQSSFAAPLTPESEAARILSEIACQVEGMYGERLENAVREVFPLTGADIPYDLFRSAVDSVLDETLTGWTRVAVMLVYSQRLTFAMVQSGHQGLNYLVDHAARLVADKAADFIISQGGWGSVAQIQISSSSSSQYGSGETSRVNSPEKWFTHSATKVETQEHSTTSYILPVPASSTPVENHRVNSDSFNGTKVQTDLSGEMVGLPIPRSPESCSSESVSLCSDSAPEVMSENNQELEHGEHKPKKESKSFISAEILKKAHTLGFSFSVAAAVIIIGIAIVLSKH